MKIIIYGCGVEGKRALEVIGEENVQAFCVTNKECDEKYNKQVLDLEELKSLLEENILVVAANEKNTAEITGILTEKGICDYFLMSDIYERILKNKISINDFCELYASREERIRYQFVFLKEKAEKEKRKNEYLKSLIDITKLKPATGYVRKKQLRSIEFAKEIFEEVKHLNIQPFLISGSAIGAFRHNGFIPWDDDLDFGLIRSDYVKLIEYFKEKKRFEICDRNLDEYTSDVHLKRMGDLVKKYENQSFLDLEVDQIQITQGTSAVDRIGIDFFAFDYYSEDTSIADVKNLILEVEIKKRQINKIDKIISFYNTEIENSTLISRIETSKIYFGIDSCCAYYRVKWNQIFFDKDKIFPLVKHRFENVEFGVAKDLKSFLEINYPNYMEWPSDFGEIAHEGYVDDFLKRNYPTVEFYLIDAFEIYHFLPLYYYFLTHGVYAKFVAEDSLNNTSGGWFDYDNALTILNDLGVRYTTIPNINADFAFTTQKADILKKYKSKKIHLTYGFGMKDNAFCESLDTIVGFDYKFVHGRYGLELCKENAKQNNCQCYEVGYFKYSNIYNKPFELKRIFEQNNNKKVLLYFPTWGAYSTIRKYANEINKLRDKYYIVTKPHHCTARLAEEKDNLELLYKISDIVLSGNDCFEELVLNASIAICDELSGSATEIPFINDSINLILLGDEKFAIKQKLRDFAETVFYPEDLLETVINTDTLDIKKENRLYLLKEIYGEFGKCDFSIVEEIIKNNCEGKK